MKLLFALAFAGLALTGYGRTPIRTTKYNLGFEYVKPDSVPAGWTVRNTSLTGYPVVVDPEVSHGGRLSAKAQWRGIQPQVAAFRSWGGFQNFLPVEEAAGREVEISGWVRTEGDGNFCAGYALFAYVPGNTGRDFMSKIDTVGGIRGTSDWRRHTVRLAVEADATAVMVAGFVAGEGTAWFDDVEIRIDGKRLEDRALPLKTELTAKDERTLRKYLYPLRTVGPEDENTEDLAVFGRLFGGCRAVALGECTHGTSEIYRMKDRIVRYLAANEGFDFFALEANLPEAYRLNDYTVNGSGDPKRLLRGMYVWPWMTEEMLTLVEWMKTYNAGERKIAFTGVDMQFYASALQLLQQKVAENPVLSGMAAEIADKMQHIYSRPYVVDMELAEAVAADLEKFVASEERTMLSEEEDAWALQCVELLRQFLSQCADIDWRDRGMAANLLRMLDRNPESRAVLWAHNQHANNRYGMTPMLRSTGSFLKQELGDRYASVGFACGRGSYLAYGQGLRAFELPAPVPGTLEYLLEQLDEPLFVLDLKRMREDKSLRWLDELEYREVGATPELFTEKGILERFDYLIFIGEASPSHFLKD